MIVEHYWDIIIHSTLGLATGFVLLILAYILIFGKVPSLRMVNIMLLCKYLVLVLIITIFSRETGEGIELNIFASIMRARGTSSPTLAANEIRGIWFNVLMFLPMGYFLPTISLRLQKLYHAVIAGFLASLAIESAQLIWQLGVFSLEDILLNTIGASIGHTIFGIKKIFTFLKKGLDKR